MIAGDGRHDSMDHSAKYGAYIVFNCDINMILDFALLQVSIRSIYLPCALCGCMLAEMSFQ